ncbi:cation diffusion facilitator family transporter [Slackia heliotrinireducens]|uniref:Cation diffusion facilitator family transporter n=1 Tax=Slackia heliotrinireducens (strain ATCC 29202 / DSM 20476 / NCTC 11029 / RHS 1) TaxID=471855 RepID=C7N853_SLAHD|nr:cation diffusion facilitator family transporter [Slackia heliotrinireducens]ACV23088.1 cation diffusion facilitator family transporter [Slackia heliotrinireducens DSM 20476]VEH02069.1 Cadmium, cobalt and zinc/H(+)-K(+) antiporter [Slackia heliotrinireducens]
MAIDTTGSQEGQQLSRDAQIVRTSIVGIAANMLLAAFKAAVGLLSNSIAIVLDAVNNLSDALSSVITIVGTKLAGRTPDRKHPYGYGRIEYITTIIIGAIVLAAGFTSLKESVSSIINHEVASYETVTLVIVAVAVVAKVVLGRYVKAVGERVGSDSLVASGTDATMDSIISASTLVAAFIYIIWGVSLEGWLGAVISVVIMKAGFDILKEALDKILGQRVDGDLSRAIKQTVAETEGVYGAYDLVLNDYGPDRLTGSVHVEVDDDATARDIDIITRRIQQAVFAKYGVIINTVGVYATNNTGLAGQIRERAYEVAKAHPEVLETHGFYLDEELDRLSFDVVVSFDSKDRQAVADEIRREVQELYPQYKTVVLLDEDVSE